MISNKELEGIVLELIKDEDSLYLLLSNSATSGQFNSTAPLVVIMINTIPVEKEGSNDENVSSSSND